MKKVLFVVAHEGYQPHEYGEPRRILEDAGISVVTASDAGGVATGKDGSTTTVDVELKDVQAADYSGVFMIGGPGALEHLDTQEVNRVYNEAMLHEIPYGAICISPRILAKAHVLVGKRATGWNGDGALEHIFAQNNVEYVGEPVVVDGNVITADGPDSADAFGRAILEQL